MKFQWVFFIVSASLLIINTSCQKEDKKLRPAVYGHGGTALSPEREVYPRNTDQSILYALDVLDADGVEIDVQMTKDSVFVVYHEDRLDGFTSGTGCINDHTYAEIQELTYFKKYTIIPLADVLTWTSERDKLIFIDIKHFNYCQNHPVNLNAIATEMSILFTTIPELDWQQVTVNSRNIDLLSYFSNPYLKKSYETDNIGEGIGYVEEGLVEKLAFKLEHMTTALANQLKNKDIPFTLFNVKTKKEIQLSATYQPDEILTDNIPATKKYFQ